MLKVVRLTLVAAAVALTVSAHAAQDPVYLTTDGVTAPRVTRKVEPTYTAEALKARIQGEVLLSAVVLIDGTVGDVTVVDSLDATHGLDQKAVDALKAWRFAPGTKDGQPVRVKVQVAMAFKLRSSSARASDFRVVIQG